MIKALEQIRVHEAIEACRLTEPLRPDAVEDRLREEQLRTQLPKLRLLTTPDLANCHFVTNRSPVANGMWVFLAISAMSGRFWC